MKAEDIADIKSVLVYCAACGQTGVPARATRILGGPDAVAPEGWIAGIPLERFGGDYALAEREMALTCSEACWAEFSKREEARGLRPIEIWQRPWREEETFVEWVAAVEKYCLAKHGKLLGSYRDVPLQDWFAAGIPSEAAALIAPGGGVHPVPAECRRRAIELADFVSRVLNRRRDRAGAQESVEFLAQAVVLDFLGDLLKGRLDPCGLGPEWFEQLKRELHLALAADAEPRARTN